MATGSLVVVGSGILASAHLTPDARHFIERADRVLYIVADPLAEAAIRKLNRKAESLAPFYGIGKPRLRTYKQMVERILQVVRSGKRVCAAFYGNPGLFASPGHVAIQKARDEGFHAEMLPGISTLDCLIADLGVDPSQGLQSQDATAFLLRGAKCDPHNALVLWQAGGVGDIAYNAPSAKHLPILAKALAASYGADHRIVLYEAASLPGLRFRAETITIRELPKAEVLHSTTLFVPPLDAPPIDKRMLRRLGMDPKPFCLRSPAA
jgi:siroheme synthase